MSFLLPSSWRSHNARRGRDGDDSLFDEEEGEGMVGFEVNAERRQELERNVGGEGGLDERRLSRDLEEGFRDDSDDDEEHGRRRSSAGI